MTQLDTRIPLMGMNPELKYANPLETAMQGLKIKGAMDQMQQQKSLREAMQVPGTPEERVKGLLDKGYVSEANELNQGYQGLENSKYEKSKAIMEDAVRKMEFGGRLLSGANDETSFQQVKAIANGMGVDTSDWPPNFNENWKRNRLNMAISVLDDLKNKYQQSELAFKTKKMQMDQENKDQQMQGAQDYRQNMMDLRKDQLEFQKDKQETKETAPMSVSDTQKLIKMKIEKGETEKLLKVMKSDRSDMDRVVDRVLEKADTPEFKAAFINVPFVEALAKEAFPGAREIAGDLESIQAKLAMLGKELTSASGSTGNPTQGEWEMFAKRVANLSKMSTPKAIEELKHIKTKYKELEGITEDFYQDVWSQFDFNQVGRRSSEASGSGEKIIKSEKW